MSRIIHAFYPVLAPSTGQPSSQHGVSPESVSTSIAQRRPRLARRSLLGFGLATVMTAGALAAAEPALAAPICGQERAYVYQTNSTGTWAGPSIDSLYNTGDINISQAATSVRYIFTAGVHRPRRSIHFTLINQDNAVVGDWDSSASDFTTVGSRVRVYADIHTRCGDDVVKYEVYVGAINTTP